MAKVLITRKIPGTALAKLQETHEVNMWDFDRQMTSQEIMEQGKEVEAIICLLNDRWTGEMMDEFPNLKVISNYAVGFDNVDIKAATEKGLVVTNTPSDEVNESVAEFTWTLLLSLSRRMTEAGEFAKKGLFWGWEPNLFLGHDIYGKTLGVIGLGRIGGMVARRAQGFNMKVLYYEREQHPDREKELGVEYRPLEQLMAESDYVTVHVPLTDETRHLIGKDQFDKAKHGSYLINTSRGGIVDEHALVDALRNGQMAGAALDVHEREPQMNPELMQMENVILTPHVASATVEVREKMTQQAVDAVIKVLSGEMPENIVNKEVWENRKK
jgi:glyoxylate reductase